MQTIGICGGFFAWVIGNEAACFNYIRLPSEFTEYQVFGAEVVFTFLFVSVIKLASGHNYEGNIIDINGYNERGHLYEVNTAYQLDLVVCLVDILILIEIKVME